MKIRGAVRWCLLTLDGAYPAVPTSFLNAKLSKPSCFLVIAPYSIHQHESSMDRLSAGQYR